MRKSLRVEKGIIVIILALALGLIGLFLKPINNLLTSDIATTLLIPAFLIYFTFIFVTKSIEKYKHENDKELEKEIFIREITSQEKHEMLQGWSSLILDKKVILGSTEKALTEKFEKLFLKTAMYGGKRLVILVTLFQSNNVKKAHLSPENKSDRDKFKPLMYMAIIASEMKKEFTDIDISPQTLIQIKFNDYMKNENLLIKLEQEIEDEYESYLKNEKSRVKIQST